MPSPLAGEGKDRGKLNKARARELRNNPTEAERLLWRHLRLRQIGGYKFRRQQPVGRYIVDFVCLEKRLIVELDGGQHQKQASYDARRSAWLQAQGFHILRFWDHEVLKHVEAVRDAIWEAVGCEFPLLNPPPQGGRKYQSVTIASGKGNK
jgi:very-short-patch-repair endonuclease